MKFTGFKTKLFVTLAAAIAAFTVSACGSSNSTITAIGTTSGVPTVWGVITTDTTAMAVIKTAEGSTSNVTVQDGDQHMGNHVCGYSASKNGHSYQIDYYTNSSAAASLLEAQCSTTAQQQFLSGAP
jgi:hypothetical protein